MHSFWHGKAEDVETAATGDVETEGTVTVEVVSVIFIVEVAGHLPHKVGQKLSTLGAEHCVTDIDAQIDESPLHISVSHKGPV